MKTFMQIPQKRIIVFLLTIPLAIVAHAQKNRKLDRLYYQQQYDKLIRASGKRIKKCEDHSREGDDVRMIHCGTTAGVSVVDLTKGYWAGMSYFLVRLVEVAD